jgi:CTP synthase (UTP-ammonia lyase)
MSEAVRIAIVGDFNPDFPSHHATTASLQHAANRLQIPVLSKWVPTSIVTEAETETVLSEYDGIWASPGSPYQSKDGMLRAIQFARTRNWPFVGT